MKSPQNVLTVAFLILLTTEACDNGWSQERSPRLAKTGRQSALPQESKNPRPARRKQVEGIEIVYSPKYSINLLGLEQMHPFDIHKYKKIVDRLVKEGVVKRQNLKEPQELSKRDILRVQSQKFLDSLNNKETVLRYLEADILRVIPASMINNGILKQFRFSAGGTLLASRIAMESRCVAVNVGGGFHHAKPDQGEGFCIYADIPIAIRQLQASGKIRKALVIDVDAHQGNGTIRCLADDPTTFCFSIHQGSIYPVPKEKGDLDIELRSGAGDQEVLEILKKQLPIIFQKSKPDLVFVVGGCDPLAGDPLAGLKMTPAGIVKRDQMIVQFAVEQHIPVVFTLAGGYSRDAWKSQYRSLKNLIEKFGKK